MGGGGGGGGRWRKNVGKIWKGGGRLSRVRVEENSVEQLGAKYLTRVLCGRAAHE